MQDYFTHSYRARADLFRNREAIREDGRYLTQRIAEEAADFIARSGERPFFLYVPFNAPHVPLQAPEEYLNRFPDLKNQRRSYAAMISAMDDAVGSIMRAVERRGFQENTFTAFYSDNGGQLPEGNNSPYRGYKLSLFDGGMHSPAIMHWPGVIRPRVVNEVAMAMDIMPTFCKAAGVPLPAGRTIDGRDILPVAAQSAKSPHDAVFWYYHDRRFPMPPQSAVRRGKWKLVVNGILFDRPLGGTNNPTLAGDDAIFLSDLSVDPGETVNLRHKYPQVADDLKNLLFRWQEEVKAD
jgi:arylsulfatase A-like enzyme